MEKLGRPAASTCPHPPNHSHHDQLRREPPTPGSIHGSRLRNELNSSGSTYTSGRLGTAYEVVPGQLDANPRIHVHLTDVRVVAEDGRGLVLHHRMPSHPLRLSPPVRDLMAKIREFIASWNRRKHSFILAKPAEEVPRQDRTQT